MRPVGFIDDDATLAGKVSNGYPVLGGLDQLDEVIAEHGVKGVVLSTSRLPEARLRSAVRTCERRGIWMKQLRLDFEVKSSGVADEDEASYNLNIQW